MVIESYPVQRTNPARDLYNLWYSLVKYNARALLTPSDNGRAETAWAFEGNRSLLVDRSDFQRGKPALYIPYVMKVWPNGHFTPLTFYTSSDRRDLSILERYTFLRWGYVARGKAIWVQDTPRQGWNAYNAGEINREYPAERDFDRATPYLPLDGVRLFLTGVRYQLKRAPNDKWIVATVRRRGQVAAVGSAQQDLDRRYAIASRRYDRYRRRAELEAIREGVIDKPRKPVSALDRINLTRAIVNSMTVYEPKTGPGGKPLAKQLSLLTPLEVTHGRNDMESCAMAR